MHPTDVVYIMELVESRLVPLRKEIAALKSVERRKTVRAKRPVQQRKVKSLLCAVKGLKCSFDVLGKCSNSSICPWQRKPSTVA